ncbi:MAG: N-acetyltransferase, partial [Acidobacteriota bacterium]|nr:N-acetyltransferase [Acidobacteriota bacterium]
MVIRYETPEDIAVIHQIIEQAFGRPAEANLVDALRRNGKAILSLVAEDNGRVVGHILFSPGVIDAAERPLPGIGLAPLAVLPERQNEGIGSLLVERGLKLCRETRHPFVIVLGHPEYYPRFGFVPASRFGVKSEYDVRDEVFMAMELQEG